MLRLLAVAVVLSAPLHADPPPAGAGAPPASSPASAGAAPRRIVSKAWGAQPDSEPPGYARPLSTRGSPGLETLTWLDFGLEHRTRWELRDDSFLRPRLDDDNQFLMRSRAYLGVRELLDPFRVAVEFQDSRQFNSDYPESNRDVDEADIVQLFGELYFRDLLGAGRPVQVRAGRMSLDYGNRRLAGRLRWRNTQNAFDGFRLRLGDSQSDWQFDLFAVQPVERRLRQRDVGDEERWFYGLVGAWRGWDSVVVLEPYGFILAEQRTQREARDREIHTLGLRAFGAIGRTGFDYEVDNAFQFGDDGEREQRAYAMNAEVGYTLRHAWKPRFSVATEYATGDRLPDDRTSERFDRLFGDSHGRSVSDTFSWQNTIAPRLRAELTPTEKVKFDAAYSAYWLASDADEWGVTGRRDPEGRSGAFVGQELDVRARITLSAHTEWELGYSYFIPGGFAQNTGPADDSDFFYTSVTIRF